jgi:hypothetical protein
LLAEWGREKLLETVQEIIYGTDRRAKAAVLMIEFRVLSFRREAIALGASLSYHPLRRERA